MMDNENKSGPHGHITWKDTLLIFSTLSAFLSGLDSWMSGQSNQNIGLCVGFGFGCGLVFGLIFLVIRRMSHSWNPKTGILISLPIGLGLGHLITMALNGYTRLFGPYSMLGLSTIIICFSLSLIATWLAVTGLNEISRWKTPALAYVGLSASAIVLWLAARNAYPDFYPGGTYTALTFSLVFGAFGLLIVFSKRPNIGHWTHRLIWSVGLAMCVNAFVFLHASQPKVRQEFDDTGPISGAYTLAVLRRLTDFDGDGYSSFFNDGDCEPFNGAIYPNSPGPKKCVPNPVNTESR